MSVYAIKQNAIRIVLLKNGCLMLGHRGATRSTQIHVFVTCHAEVVVSVSNFTPKSTPKVFSIPLSVSIGSC